MADVANAAVVSKDTSDLTKNVVSSECSDTNTTKPESLTPAYQEIDSFSDLSFRTGDEISLQDIMESEFAARMSGLSAEASPNEETRDGFDNFDDLHDFINREKDDTQQLDVIKVDEPSIGMSLDEFLGSPGDEVDQVQTSVNPDLLSGNSSPLTQPDLVAFKCTRPSEMPIISSFDPFARIEEDSDASNSNPVSSSNVLNSPDEFAFPESPQDGQVACNEPMVDLFVNAVSDENLDLSDPVPSELGRFNTSSVESVNNSCPNISDLTSPDRADNEEMLSDDVISSEPVDTVVDQDEGTGSSSHHVDLSTDETETGIEDHKKEEAMSDLPELAGQPEHLSQVDYVVSPPLEREQSPVSNGREDISLHEEVKPAKMSPLSHSDEMISPEEDKSLSISEKLDYHAEELAEDIGPVLAPASPEEDKSLSTSEKLDYHIEDLIEDIVPVFQTMLAPIAAEEEEEEDEWTTVEEALGKVIKEEEELLRCGGLKDAPEEDADAQEADVPVVVCPVINPSVVTNTPDILIIAAEPAPSDEDCSQTESDLSTHSEKRSSKKKATSSSSETSVKRTKKTKKSDEKENISVEEPVGQLAAEPTESLSLISHSASASDADDLLNVSVRDIMQTYCSEAAKSFENKLMVEEIIPSPVPIQNLKTSFSKFDQLSKKTVIHVRSCDSSKAQKQFSDAAAAGGEVSNNCRSCGKLVFQMEQIKAERAVWHKNCFRCKECNKQLTSDTYSSHEGILYCKPHFKELFKPKAVVEDDEPPSDKPDLGLEELASLNVRSKFQVFEKGEESDEQERPDPGVANVKRSPSILSKLAKFQNKGMDMGVTDDSLNGVPHEQSPCSSEEEEDNENGPRKVIKSKKLREKPISFGNMEEVKSAWANGVTKTKEELREERKQEIQQIRSRLFQGKQVKMKEAYEQAVRESEATNSPRKSVDLVCSERAKSIKECFEKGEPLNVDDETAVDAPKDHRKNLSDDAEVFEAGISKKSRSLFIELDKSAKIQEQTAPKPTPRTPATPTKPRETESPEPEVYRDPSVVRAADRIEPDVIRSNTTAKMLSLFRQLEERTDEVPEGLKPLKCFTPPPDYKEEEQTEESEEESEEEYEDEDEEEQNVNPNLVRASDKVEDDYLKQAANAVRAKQLRAKFEKWEEKEMQREQQEKTVNGNSATLPIDSNESVEVTSIECTKSLLARFESMRTETDPSKEKLPRPKVNRFVEIQNCAEELCEVCHSRVYSLERIETSGKIFHKTCFRCDQCNCLLRLETFTLNCGRLYCMPHFRQLFTVKGNYDEGFGVDQHKAKWPRVASTC